MVTCDPRISMFGGKIAAVQTLAPNVGARVLHSY